MKIIHIFDHSFPIQDGYSTRSFAILREQIKRNWKVYPITGPRQGFSNNNSEIISNINFFRTKNNIPFLSKIPVFKQFWTIWLIYKRSIFIALQVQPDIIHAHSPALNGIAAIFVARRLHVPVVYEVRAFWEDAAVDQGTSTYKGLRYKMTRLLENYVFRKVNQAFAICNGLKEDIDNRNICSEKVVVVPNAVDFERFSTTIERQQDLVFQLGLTEGLTLGFIGSFYDYEGLDLAIQAMPKILEINSNIKLLLVGSGLQEKSLQELTTRLNLHKNVIFTGKVPFHEVEKYYSVIDILIYPRKKLRLTELVTPLKPLEAMAQGKVFIASDVGGHRELIDNGSNGILFKAESLDSFIDAIKNVLSDELLRKKIKINAVEFVRRERNWTKSVDAYEDVYKLLSIRL